MAEGMATTGSLSQAAGQRGIEMATGVDLQPSDKDDNGYACPFGPSSGHPPHLPYLSHHPSP